MISPIEVVVVDSNLTTLSGTVVPFDLAQLMPEASILIKSSTVLAEGYNCAVQLEAIGSHPPVPVGGEAVIV
ncbi:hypothetical protein GCM10008018_72070 [Paenibacillus marchantiophytorum]|uniref:Uncharacterized protein n=1 Tax=Paenibacillus marchantiophytorum TaxID=1619310 RepID=A0ABQ1FKX4_9BACL|nr:hypothetical protein GCM10008018_72070 [Paenibacillus marchantiophytorum]